MTVIGQSLHLIWGFKAPRRTESGHWEALARNTWSHSSMNTTKTTGQCEQNKKRKTNWRRNGIQTFTSNEVKQKQMVTKKSRRTT